MARAAEALVIAARIDREFLHARHRSGRVRTNLPERRSGRGRDRPEPSVRKIPSLVPATRIHAHLSFQGPPTPHCPLAQAVAGPRNLPSATSKAVAAARTGLAAAMCPDEASAAPARWSRPPMADGRFLSRAQASRQGRIAGWRSFGMTDWWDRRGPGRPRAGEAPFGKCNEPRRGLYRIRENNIGSAEGRRTARDTEDNRLFLCISGCSLFLCTPSLFLDLHERKTGSFCGFSIIAVPAAGFILDPGLPAPLVARAGPGSSR